MRLVLNIHVLPGMDIQQFVIPLDLAGPATLEIKPGIGRGNFISILDEAGGKREWYATEICGLHFEGD